MKTSIIAFLAITIISQVVYSEEIRSASDIIALKETKRFRYILKTELLQVILLNMNYGDSYVISEIDRQKLKNTDVQLIDLVFTDFPKGEDLKALNLSRIKVVVGLRKSLVTDVNIR